MYSDILYEYTKPKAQYSNSQYPPVSYTNFFKIKPTNYVVH